ncbi:GNAT family N-acetyltransferase [Vallitalea pronyensis]|uniref:GNAT family N-acetyltransferase n=1 Tax=Vallitalea pronyensis TaxID=1348613 RepID=A0A8J8SI51_9FIRM|nr:GNAT family protein [Vallitalea pronyensis]QUI24089.1 GNAT family N-acetyltransferase [Vallitalea pronyensis]
MQKNPMFLGEKVYLVPIESQHLEVYYEKLQEASYDSCFYTGSKKIITMAQLKAYVERIEVDNERLDLFIVSQKADEIVGEVVLNDIDFENRCSSIRIALFLDENFNQGYGSEAMALTVNYGFGMFNLNRIELEVYAYNERAIHVYKKLGFKEEGICRQCLYFNHAYHDAYRMSILSQEYKGLNPS